MIYRKKEILQSIAFYRRRPTYGMFVMSLMLPLLVALKLQPTMGFAAWLKCYVDITDTEEIIMNYLILPKESARHEGVQIEVKRLDDDYWVTENFTFDSTRTTSVMARLKVPPELAETDVQYAMEIISNNDSNPDGNVKFTRPANVCKGKRAHATHYTESAILEIPAATEDTIPSPVKLIAVYATGHEAVTQTDIMVLQPNDIELEL